MQSCSFHSESIHSLRSRSHFCFSYGRHHFEYHQSRVSQPLPGERTGPGRVTGLGRPGHPCLCGGRSLLARTGYGTVLCWALVMDLCMHKRFKTNLQNKTKTT